MNQMVTALVLVAILIYIFSVFSYSLDTIRGDQAILDKEVHAILAPHPHLPPVQHTPNRLHSATVRRPAASIATHSNRPTERPVPWP